MLTRLHRLFMNPLAGPLFGAALDTVTSTGTAIGATLAATTIVPGDSFQVKNTNGGTPAWLLNFWAKNQVTGMARIRSPKLHDNVDAIRNRVVAGTIDPLMPLGIPQRLYAQDVLIVELAGSGTAGQIEDVVELIYYEDLPGQAARFIDVPTLGSRIVNIIGVRLAVTMGTTAGYSGQLALNANVDLMQANTDYALMGIHVDARCAAVSVRGPDTGNLRVSAPGEPSKLHVTGEWFPRITRAYGKPLIPVINSANKAATFVDVVSDQAGGTNNVTLLMAQLK